MDGVSPDANISGNTARMPIEPSWFTGSRVDDPIRKHPHPCPSIPLPKTQKHFLLSLFCSTSISEPAVGQLYFDGLLQLQATSVGATCLGLGDVPLKKTCIYVWENIYARCVASCLGARVRHHVLVQIHGSCLAKNNNMDRGGHGLRNVRW